MRQGRALLGFGVPVLHAKEFFTQSHPPVRYGCVLVEGNVMV